MLRGLKQTCFPQLLKTTKGRQLVQSRSVSMISTTTSLLSNTLLNSKIIVMSVSLCTITGGWLYLGQPNIIKGSYLDSINEVKDSHPPKPKPLNPSKSKSKTPGSYLSALADESESEEDEVSKRSPVFPYDPTNFPEQHIFRKQVHGDKEFPVLSLAEVQADHGSEIWVVFEGGVFNVTDFLEAHPGHTYIYIYIFSST